MKKHLLTLLILFLTVFTLVGCGAITTYENEEDAVKAKLDALNKPNASADKDSWLQWKEYDDEIIDIDWYVDMTSFSYNNATLIANKIKEITGINIRFQTPSTADGSKLSTLISGNKLPDVISIAANQADRIQLAEEEGYMYSMNDLAERWAPSLLNRLDPELVSLYSASDGKLYGIPQYFYSIEALTDMQTVNSSYCSNGAIVARKDYLDAYHEYKRSEDPNFDPATVCTPQGVLEMCLWVKEHFNLSNSNPTVMLAPFENQRTHGSVGIRWLMEYFSVLQEDKDGNFVYQWETPEFEEMMLWLNDLYTNHLLQTSDFTNTSSQVGTNIQNGYPFIFIGSPQDYTNNFKYWILHNPKGTDAEYVPIIFGNSAGTVPQLSITGNSYMFNMISQNCKRPDRVIKLFDFLYSEEGQRLMYFGIEASGSDDENGTYYYTKAPGTTETINGKEYTYKYGQIEFTNKLQKAFNDQTTSSYGFSSPSVGLSGSYVYLACCRAGMFYTYSNYVLYNLKANVLPYTYIYRGFEFELDPTKEEYMDMVTIETNLRLLWLEYYKEIICSKNHAQAKSLIEDTLASARRRGLNKYIAFKNASFQAHKTKYGIEFASPINDPNNTAYKALKFTSIYGDPSYYKEAPASIERK